MEATSSADECVKRLRRQLESWREVLVALYSLLVWDKPFYPAITASIVTTIFVLVWYLEPSVLTLLSIVGLIITLADFLVPQVVPLVLGGHSWTGAQERRYESIVCGLSTVLTSCSCWSAALATLKATRPKLYFLTVTLTLLTTAWFGASFNNLWLTYCSVMLVLLVPGLYQRGVLHRHLSGLLSRVSALLRTEQPAPPVHAKLQ
ncbi:hypothetical protein FHG87_017112 [Trinorchestia longiramus]|nr:hypothetical protein FHG87_017112 [Trinorchestia longiramus]